MNRRQFMQGVAGGAAGLVASDLLAATASAATPATAGSYAEKLRQILARG